MLVNPLKNLIKHVDESEVKRYKQEDYTLLDSYFVLDMMEETLTAYFEVSSVEVERIIITRYGKIYLEYNYYNTHIQGNTVGVVTME